MNAPIAYPINLILIIIGSFLSVSLSVFLLSNKSSKNKANTILGVLILVITTYFLPGFFYRFDLLTQMPHLVGISNVMTFLIGPLSYLYVCACTQKEFQMRPISWLHFLPFVLDVLFFAPHFLKSGPEKVEIYLGFIKGGNTLQSPYLLLLKALHGITYVAFAARLIVQYRRHLSDTTSNIDNAYHRWMLVFLFMLACPIIGLTGFAIFDYQRVLLLISLLSLFCFLLAVYFMALVKPEVFHAFPHQMPVSEVAEAAAQREKYEGSKLQATQKEAYLEKLIVHVKHEKPYQNPELTLDELSEQVKIPSHYLSQVINEKLNIHFLDFINGYRVKDAQEKLTNPKLSHYTILAIAYEAGFNAKSTFYAVFKKHTGMTPSEFRKTA